MASPQRLKSGRRRKLRKMVAKKPITIPQQQRPNHKRGVRVVGEDNIVRFLPKEKTD